MFECRNDFDIFADLAARVGINDYNDKSEMEWLRELTSKAVDDFDTFRRQRCGPLRTAAGRCGVRRPDSRSRKPSLHHAVGQDRDLLDGLAAKRGLLRARGTFRPFPTWIEPATPEATLSVDAVRSQVASAHAFDPRQQPAAARARRSRRCLDESRRAAARSIANGDTVRVFNDRGATLLPVKVTRAHHARHRLDWEGAWYTPDIRHRHAGCANVLSPGPRPAAPHDLQHEPWSSGVERAGHPFSPPT